MTFSGVHWRELEQLVRPKPSARFAIAHAEQGFTANVPISFLRDEHALLATHADGEPLAAEHGWPLRLVIPGKYFWKSAKWLRGIELSATDQPGFWERYGYHNDADPSRSSATSSKAWEPMFPHEPLLLRRHRRTRRLPPKPAPHHPTALTRPCLLADHSFE